MKIVVNAQYGGFGVSEQALAILGDKFDKWDDNCRANASLIELIEEKGSKFVSDRWSTLEIVEIPEEATDWKIFEDDGYETLIYVLNGRIFEAYEGGEEEEED